MTERLPWASGKTKPPPTAKPKPRRRRRRMTTRGKALLAFWEGGGLILLGCAQIFQLSALIFAGATSMALGAVTVWAERHSNTAVPTPNAAKPRSANSPGNARSGRGRAQPGTAVPNCTRTGQPIDRCGCAARHVASEAGVRRYKQAKRVGDPLGGSKATTTKTKEPRVPTTNNAKPQPVGEPMRRVL